MSTIAERVKNIVVEQLQVSAEQVTEDAKFVEDLGADSLDQVELVMALEEEPGILCKFISIGLQLTVGKCS